jgi:hypothetical protein
MNKGKRAPKKACTEDVYYVVLTIASGLTNLYDILEL